MIFLENFEDQSNIGDIQENYTAKIILSFVYQIVILLLYLVNSGLFERKMWIVLWRDVAFTTKIWQNGEDADACR